jgi:hypothetical protein
VTKEVVDLVDVVLDSGAVERCTPEHLWMLRNGTYKAAKDLRPGIDRLMPINRQWPVNGGYERFTDKGGNKILTHHMVASFFEGTQIPQGCCVHHRNGNKTDNRPDNLSIELLEAHARAHTSFRHATDADWRARLYAGAKVFNESEEGRRKHSEALKRTIESMSEEQRKDRARRSPRFRRDIDLYSLESIREDSEALNANAAARILGCGRNVVVRVLKEHGFTSWEDFVASDPGNNHKIRAVIPVRLPIPVPVYDLEVEAFSNFALASGVFVHNSKDCSDALAGVCFTLSSQQAMLPIPMMRGLSYYGEAWMEEQQHAVAAGNLEAGSNQRLTDLQMLPPFLIGGGAGYGDDWGGGWGQGSL